MTIAQLIDFCKKKMSKGGIDFEAYRALMDILLLAEKYDLVPGEIDGKEYQLFVGHYYAFRRNRGSEPKMNPAAGKALKDVIRYLLKLEKVGNDPEKALASWSYILNNWDFLSDYIRQQVALIQINKNIEEIIEQLTNASKNAKKQHNDSEKQRLKDAIKSR